MVFLAMMPGEMGHNREPAYNRDIAWPPVFRLQQRSDFPPRPESSLTDETSGSQDGCNMASNDTTPPPEGELSSEHSIVKLDTKAMIVNPKTSLEKLPLSEEGTFDTSRAISRDLSPLAIAPPIQPSPWREVIAKFVNRQSDPEPHPTLASAEVTSWREVIADFVSQCSKNESSPNETSVPEKSAVIAVKPRPWREVISEFVSRYPEIHTATAEEMVAPSVSESVTKLALHDQELIPNKSAEDERSSVIIEAPIDTTSFAISCTSTFPAFEPPSTRLRRMIAKYPSIITCPGVYDGLSARIALHVGFKAMYMTGAGTTASCLGASDLGIAHLYDMKTNAEMIANLQPDGPPLIADMDTGYGGPLIISRAVKQYARAGVAAFHIEDQVPEKRCGHLAGKEVVDVETYLRRIRACIDARTQIRSDIIIIARTDALQSRGYDDCIERLKRARELGADMGILEGVSSKEMAAQAVKDLAPWPLCYNSVENGHSPLITADEAQAMGYKLMIFSFAGIAPAYMAIMDTFTRLKETGVTGSIVGPKKIFEVCGLEEEIRIDGAAGSSMLAKGV